MKYFRQLDGLRAIAIIGVMIAHWVQKVISIPVLKNIPYGSGVTLFFVISGFLITKILLDFKELNLETNQNQWKSIKSFYMRRSLRIFPVYYLTIFVILALDFDRIGELFPWLATYTTNIYMTINSEYIGPFTHFWSLAVEEQFYLVWVFAIVFVPRQYIRKVILFCIGISLLLLYYSKYFTPYFLANSLVICQMHTLGAGALLAWYARYRPDALTHITTSRLKVLFWSAVLIFTLLFIYRKPDALYAAIKDFRNPALTLIYFLMVMLAVRNGFSGLSKRILESSIMVYIGKISYGLYVYHLFMGPIFRNFLKPILPFSTTITGYAIIYFFMNLALASMSWYLFEKPILRLKKYFRY